MANIKIVTDSSITIEPEVVEEYGITIVPLSVMVDGVLYSDSELGEGDFLRLMQSSKNLPKTSQPPVGVFAEVYEKLAADGAHIVSIHMSHALSGTVEAARQGATLSGAEVTVIDSGFTDQAMKFQVVEAAKLAKEGADLDTVLARIEEVKEKAKEINAELNEIRKEIRLCKAIFKDSYKIAEKKRQALALQKQADKELRENEHKRRSR